MIELNGIYKLKKIKGFNSNDDCDYKVVAIDNKTKQHALLKAENDKKVLAIDKDAKHETAYCENLTTGECFCFWTEFLIDPEKPEDCVCKLLKISK